jgi:hypothetical protein
MSFSENITANFTPNLYLLQNQEVSRIACIFPEEKATIM